MLSLFYSREVFMKKFLSVTKVIFDVLSWIIIGVLTISIIFSFIAHANGSIPSAFGYTVYRVSSESMKPQLEVGDVIIGKIIENPEEIKAGDIITFKGKGFYEGKFITHEVIVAPEYEDGVLMLQTKGTNNSIPDSPIRADSVISVMVTEVPFLTTFYAFFLSPWGFLVIIFLIILVFIDEVIALIKGLSGKTEDVEPADINDIIHKIKAEEDISNQDKEE